MRSKVTSRCLPVTALAIVDLGERGENCVLVGQGSSVKVISLDTHDCFVEAQVFATQTIHGIVHNRPASTEADFAILLWGGRSIMICKAKISPQYDVQDLEIGSEIQASDWILQAVFVAPWGSIIPPTAALVTAHNTIHLLNQKADAADLETQYHIEDIADGPKSILYSCSIVALTSGVLLVASGTVFGEILVWSCTNENDASSHGISTWNSRTHHAFRGHQGSVFGVAISQQIPGSGHASTRFLASCSDDRTIQIWNIGACLADDDGTVRRRFETLPAENYETGFGVAEASNGSDQSLPAASIYAHASRIWNVNFIYSDILPSTLYLVSQGEDATLQQWHVPYSLNPLTKSVELDWISRDHFHSGKNIWSSAFWTSKDRKCWLLTGGADGSIISRPCQWTASLSVDEDRPYSIAFTDMLKRRKAQSDSLSHPGGNDMLMHYGWISGHSLVATTKHGSVVQLTGLGQKYNNMSWKFLEAPKTIGSYSVLAASVLSGLALIGTNIGDLWLVYDGNSTLNFLHCVDRKIGSICLLDLRNDSGSTVQENSKLTYAVVTCMGSDTAHLIEIPPQITSASSYTERDLTFELPETFQVTRGLMMREHALILLGSRAGAIAGYQYTDSGSQSSISISLLFCKRRIHGQNAVTSIVALPASSSSDILFLTCGRDGYYAIHTCDLNIRKLQTVHRTGLPFGPYVEGAYFTKISHYLHLYGFRSKDFVVFNDSLQTEIFSVECGGAHRRWALCPDTDSETAGSFVWTQASSFHLARFSSPSHKVLQAGSHGRESKAGACRPLSDTEILVATGAEDTTIRLSICTISPNNDTFRSLRTLNKHTVGIQHLAWSPCGKYLFSSAGYEELYVWRIKPDIPGFGFGVVCEAELPKEKTVSDLRITSFDVFASPIDGDSNSGSSILLCVVYSNSTLKVFQYSTADALFTLVQQGLYGNNCLTQANILQVPTETQVELLTAGTDGRIALWTTTTSFRYSDTEFIRPSRTHQIHQSSVKCLSLHSLSQYDHFVVTGGDDNAIGLTLIRGRVPPPHKPTPLTEEQQFATLLIPNAHAAAITGLSISPITNLAVINDSHSSPNMRGNQKNFLICSVGCDQRFKTWRLKIDCSILESADTENLLSAMTVIREEDEHTAVADPADMTIASPDKGSAETIVVIAGVGLEVRKL